MFLRAALLATFCALAFSASADEFIVEWTRMPSGGSFNDVAVDVTTDAANNIYVFGITATAASNKYMVVKYDSAGNVIWTRIFGPTAASNAVRIAVDPVGNVYTAGYSIGNAHIMIRKMDSEGDLVYETLYNRTATVDTDILNDFVLDASGNCYFAAQCEVGPDYDFVVGSLNAAGELAWEQTKNGPGNLDDSANALIYDNGFVYVTGFVKNPGHERDIVTGKYNAATGAELWYQAVHQAHNDFATGDDIDIDHLGRIIVGGNCTRTDGNASTLILTLSPDTGAVISPNLAVPNAGTHYLGASYGFFSRDIAVGTPTVGGVATDFTFAIGQGTVNGLPNIVLLNPAAETITGAGTTVPSTAGAIVADDQGAAYSVGSYNSFTAANKRDMIVFRRLAVAGGFGGTLYSYNGPGSGHDVGFGIALDGNENIIVVGLTSNATEDMLVMKLVQTPYAIADVFHAFTNTTLNVPAAQGVKKNDVGAKTGNASQATAASHAFNVTVGADGSLFYMPETNYVGTDSFDYNVSKVMPGSIIKTSDPATVTVYVHPAVQTLDAPATMIGGDSDIATITLSGAEPDVAISGSTSSNSPSLVSFPNGGIWTPLAGASSSFIAFQTKPVGVDTTVTLTATRGPSSATDSITLKPGGLSLFSLNPNSVNGGESTNGTVTLTGNAPVGGIQVNLNTNSGSITVPDYVTVGDGQNSHTFGIPTLAVNATATRTITATRGSVSKTALLTLKAVPKLATLTLNPTTVYGRQDSVGTITLTAAAPAGGTTVTLADNSASIVTPASALVPQATTSVQFTVQTLKVGVSATRTITATLNSVNRVASLTLTPGPDLYSLQIQPNVITGGETTSAVTMVTTNANNGPIQVAISDNSGSIGTPASVTVNNGTAFAGFNITSTPVASSATRQVTATLWGVSKSASITLHPTPILASLSISPNSVQGGQGTTGTVTYHVPAGSNAVTNLTDNSGSISTPANVTVPNGATQGNFAIATSAVSSTATRTVTATRNGVTKTASLTLTP